LPLETSPEQPIPVRTAARLIGDWVARLGRVWVEGQVAQLTRRPGTSTCFLTLRDPVADISINVTCPTRVLDAVVPPLVDGARIVVWAKPDFYLQRGSLSLAALEIRPVGLGQLLARLEQLRVTLAAEGLFAANRKRPLPFLPRTVGLICGRGSAAERDVLENARRRWPGVSVRVENVAVQGAYAVPEVIAALQRLDRDAEVDVIVVTRGGGSVEDLLPFSEENLIRAVSACLTPVVSAIGHEQDAPLLDLVADARASTPTDAARLVVPDVLEETAGLARSRDRARRAIDGLLQREQHGLDTVRARPVLRAPEVGLEARAADIRGAAERVRRAVSHRLDRAADELVHTRAQVLALSPASTLARGYAILQHAGGQVVREPADVAEHELLQAHVAGGSFDVRRVDAADLGSAP
jgi:exodeoxyribonuclease VII large subunit